jgi:hypothetical protein
MLQETPQNSSPSATNCIYILSPQVMSHESGIWPQGMPLGNINLILRLFTILDDSSDDSGQRLADEIFTIDGRIKNGINAFSGQAGMLILSNCAGSFGIPSMVSTLLLKVLELATAEHGVVRNCRFSEKGLGCLVNP